MAFFGGRHAARDSGARGAARPGVARLILLLGLLAMCGAAAEGAMTDWSAVYLHDELGASAALASAGLTVFSAAVAAGRLCGDRLVARLGPSGLVRISAAAGGIGLAAGIAVRTAAGAFAGLALMGLGLAGVVPQIISVVGRAATGRAGRDIAVVTGLSTAGNLGGPVAIGAVASAAGLPLAVAVPAALIIVVALATGILPGRDGEPAPRVRSGP